MHKAIISDTSCLILLDKIGELEITSDHLRRIGLNTLELGKIKLSSKDGLSFIISDNNFHDLNGYKIPSHIDVAITSNSIDESVEDHFLVGLEDEYKTYLLNRITHFS